MPSSVYITKNFKRTKPFPLDSYSVISSLSNADTEYPKVHRYEGHIVYSLSEKSFYFVNDESELVLFEGGNTQGNYYGHVLNWTARNENGYLDYTELKNFIYQNYPSGHKVRVYPLGIDIITYSQEGVKYVVSDIKAPEISFEMMEVGGDSYGSEIYTYLINFLLPENADVNISKFLDSETEEETLNENGAVYRVNKTQIVDYVPNISDLSEPYYIRGRYYKNGQNFYLCNGATNNSDSLILIGGGSGQSSNVGVMILPNTNLVKSDSVSYPFLNLIQDSKNVLNTGLAGNLVHELYEVIDFEDYKEIVKPDYINFVDNGNTKIIVQSRYNVTADLIAIYYE